MAARPQEPEAPAEAAPEQPQEGVSIDLNRVVARLQEQIGQLVVQNAYKDEVIERLQEALVQKKGTP